MTIQKNISALLLDDHLIIRQSCRELLEKENINIAWEGEDGGEAYNNYVSSKPDIAIIDLSVKGTSGMEAIRLIRNHDNNAKIIVFSMHTDSIFISRAFHLGVLCYVSKICHPEELITAIRLALIGKSYISNEIDYTLKQSNNIDALSLLTVKEHNIFQLIIMGQSTISIGKKLNISTKTVSTHLNKIKQKLDAKTISDLVRISITLGILSKKNN